MKKGPVPGLPRGKAALAEMTPHERSRLAARLVSPADIERESAMIANVRHLIGEPETDRPCLSPQRRKSLAERYAKEGLSGAVGSLLAAHSPEELAASRAEADAAVQARRDAPRLRREAEARRVEENKARRAAEKADKARAALVKAGVLSPPEMSGAPVVVVIETRSGPGRRDPQTRRVFAIREKVATAYTAAEYAARGSDAEPIGSSTLPCMDDPTRSGPYQALRMSLEARGYSIIDVVRDDEPTEGGTEHDR